MFRLRPMKVDTSSGLEIRRLLNHTRSSFWCWGSNHLTDPHLSLALIWQSEGHQMKSYAARAGDQIRRFEGQLRHLAIPEIMNIDVFRDVSWVQASAFVVASCLRVLTWSCLAVLKLLELRNVPESVCIWGQCSHSYSCISARSYGAAVRDRIGR